MIDIAAQQVHPQFRATQRAELVVFQAFLAHSEVVFQAFLAYSEVVFQAFFGSKQVVLAASGG